MISESKSNPQNNRKIHFTLHLNLTLSRIKLTFAIDPPCDGRHQPSTSLVWQIGCHSNQSETSITHLSYAVLTLYLLWRFPGTKASITHLAAMVTQLPWQPERNLNYFFVLNCIEFMFGMEVSWDNRHQPHTLLLW